MLDQAFSSAYIQKKIIKCQSQWKDLNVDLLRSSKGLSSFKEKKNYFTLSSIIVFFFF